MRATRGLAAEFGGDARVEGGDAFEGEVAGGEECGEGPGGGFGFVDGHGEVGGGFVGEGLGAFETVGFLDFGGGRAAKAASGLSGAFRRGRGGSGRSWRRSRRGVLPR